MVKEKFEHSVHVAEVNAIYSVAKLKKEVAYSDFDRDIRRLYDAIKCYQPWQIILRYTDENGKKVEMSVEEAGRTDSCKTVRAVAAVGRCIVAGKEQADEQATIDLYCLGHYTPTALLSGRGSIFSSDSTHAILCRRTSDLMIELLK